MSLNIQEKDPVTGELKRKVVAGTYVPNAGGIVYDNTESGLTSGNVQGAIDEVAKAIPKPTVSITSPYTKLGVQLGAVPGNIRSRSEPINTILILGNSLTGCHLTYTVDGVSIDELREVGATHPNSGWIGLIHNYLVTIYPNIKIYKTNAAIWEQTTHSEGRSYNLIKDLEVYEVTGNGSFKVPNKTVNDILPLADFVTIDLFENIQDCVAATNVSELTDDYDNLLLELKAVNSNAFYSLFFGFWYDKWKKAALLNTRSEWNFWGEPSFLPCWMSDNRYYCGEAMQYGIDGSEIGTIVPAAATHPNDDAYYLMACQWLYHVFNVSNKNRCPVYTPDTRAVTLATHDIFNPPQQSSYDFNTDLRTTDYPTLHPIRDRYYYAMPGNYIAGLLCGVTKGLGSEHLSINPAYGLLSISYVSGSYVMDFTGSWTLPTNEIYGFVIRECLLSTLSGSFRPHYLGKYQLVNQNDEFPINFDDFLLDSMTGWIIDPAERRLIGIASSARDTGYPAEGWFSLWTSSSDANQAIQYCITPAGQRFVRNRSASGWSTWATY